MDDAPPEDIIPFKKVRKSNKSILLYSTLAH